MKYRATAALAVAFGLWQVSTSPALAFCGFVAAGIAGLGYAAAQGGIRG